MHARTHTHTHYTTTIIVHVLEEVQDLVELLGLLCIENKQDCHASKKSFAVPD